MTQEYNQRHGGPWDRGSADAYYRRKFNPHYYKGETSTTPLIEKEQMTPEEVAAYTAGYIWQERSGVHK